MTSLLASLIEQDYGIKGHGNYLRSKDHDSLVLDLKQDKFYWNSQGIFGNIIDYLTKVRGLSLNQAKDLIKHSPNGRLFREPESDESIPYEELIDLFWKNGKKNRSYWYHRLLSDDYINRYRLGNFETWFTVPLYDLNGNFVNFQCRRDEPDRRMKYWYKSNNNTKFKPVLFNAPLLQFVDTIYIVEGLIDSIKLTQEGIPTISQSGGANYWNRDWYPLFNEIRKIFIIADNDLVGKKGSIKIANELGVNRAKIFCFDNGIDKFDTIDYFRSGGTSKEFKELVNEKSKYAFQMEKSK